MELAKLRYFYTVAKLGHVTRAAEEIHIAQPALTKAIKQLEEVLGVPLFYKKGRNIRTTAFGEYLKGKLEGILMQLDSIPAELESLKAEQSRTVKINVLAASTAVTDAVVAYKKRHPEIIFQLIRSPKETQCDISVATDAADLSALPAVSKTLAIEERIYLAVPKDSRYAEKDSITLSLVKDEGFVHMAGSRLFSAICDRFCVNAGFKPHISFESDSHVAVKNIIGAHAGVGFWPEYSWGKVSSDVALLPISDQDCKRTLTLSLHQNPIPSPIAEDFYAYLIKFLKKLKNTAQTARLTPKPCKNAF